MPDGLGEGGVEVGGEMGDFGGGFGVGGKGGEGVVAGEGDEVTRACGVRGGRAGKVGEGFEVAAGTEDVDVVGEGVGVVVVVSIKNQHFFVVWRRRGTYPPRRMSTNPSGRSSHSLRSFGSR